MSDDNNGENGSSLIELTKFLGVGWKPISVQTQRHQENPNLLQQTITLSYVKVQDPEEEAEALQKQSNLQIRVFSEDAPSQEQ